jgi:hypothetical protein
MRASRKFAAALTRPLGDKPDRSRKRLRALTAAGLDFFLQACISRHAHTRRHPAGAAGADRSKHRSEISVPACAGGRDMGAKNQSAPWTPPSCVGGWLHLRCTANGKSAITYIPTYLVAVKIGNGEAGSPAAVISHLIACPSIVPSINPPSLQPPGEPVPRQRKQGREARSRAALQRPAGRHRSSPLFPSPPTQSIRHGGRCHLRTLACACARHRPDGPRPSRSLSTFSVCDYGMIPHRDGALAETRRVPSHIENA